MLNGHGTCELADGLVCSIIHLREKRPLGTPTARELD